MAFIVENGSGIKNANSMATVAFFKSYFGDRGKDISALSDEKIQQLLVAGADYIKIRFGRIFRGRTKWRNLLSRSTLTFTEQPTDGQTVIVGSTTFTFRTTASEVTDVEIGRNTLQSIINLQSKLASDEIRLSERLDLDEAVLTVYTDYDGVSVSTTVTNATFLPANTTGSSAQPQTMPFPRVGLYDRNGDLVSGVPFDIQAANAEYALRANTADLAPDPTIDASGRSVTRTRKKVGPIERETEFAEGSSIRITRPYPATDRLLFPYTAQQGVIRN